MDALPLYYAGRLSFWGNYFLPTPVSLWRSDLGPMGVSDHCYTRSDDLLAIGATGSMTPLYVCAWGRGKLGEGGT